MHSDQKMQNHQKTKLRPNILSEDVLIEIYSYLIDKLWIFTQSRLALVSQTWYHATHHDQFWKQE